MALCDGSVRSIGYSIAPNVHADLCNRNDGQPMDAGSSATRKIQAQRDLRRYRPLSNVSVAGWAENAQTADLPSEIPPTRNHPVSRKPTLRRLYYVVPSTSIVRHCVGVANKPFLSTVCCLAACTAAAARASENLAKVDMPGIVSHNDVVYLSPALQGWDGLPLGNGTLGAQAWQPDGLTFQLNTPLSTAYGKGIARLHLSTAPEMFAGMRSYRQRLSLYDATLHTDITTRSGEIHALSLIPADTDALVIQYSDTRPEAVAGLLELEAWHPSASRKDEQNVDGCSLLVTDVLQYPGEPDYRVAVAVGVDGAAAVHAWEGHSAMRLQFRRSSSPCGWPWPALATPRPIPRRWRRPSWPPCANAALPPFDSRTRSGGRTSGRNRSSSSRRTTAWPITSSTSGTCTSTRWAPARGVKCP